ncbi:siroheme synthase [Auricularia subglabra TFB-10046 SS5]|nr:siroheme synthase [Auricularia subglabra TFB-10046 SS5]
MDASLRASDRVQPGGSLIIAWQLKHRHVLIVGGGEVAAGRLSAVLSADATVTLIAPRDRLDPAVVATIKYYPHKVTYRDRAFKDSDLDDVSFVLTAVDDPETSRRIVEQCRARRIPANAADLPALCDFYFGSQIRQGPLQIMISTNGNGPKLANIIKRRIEASLPPNAGKAIDNVGVLRTKLRQRAPGTGGALGVARMAWMSQVCEQWSLDELACMDERVMDRLLAEGWERDRRTVPRFVDVGGVFPQYSPRPNAWHDARWRNGFSIGVLAGLATAASLAALTLLARRRR